MRFFVFLICSALCVFAQQQTIPSEFDLTQRKLYEKVTQSVSAPCCRNAIPVAYHESGMSLQIRDMVKDWILEHKSESQIMDELDKLRLGPDQAPVIFTVPRENSLGLLTWAIPGLVLLLGGGVIFWKVRMATPAQPVLSDNALLEKYREHILAQLSQDNQKQQARTT